MSIIPEVRAVKQLKQYYKMMEDAKASMQKGGRKTRKKRLRKNRKTRKGGRRKRRRRNKKTKRQISSR